MGEVVDRWAQLTYSSFDRNDGTGGGWQVKDTTGAMDRAEQELLRGRVQTQFDAGVTLPRFPTPAELEELPRRLVHARARALGAETALWHHVPAGNDASGRPGNVFAHVVLDRNPDAPDELRPIERWRSPDWLTPFGPEAVLRAALTDAQPPAPGPVNRETVASWLFAPRRWRLQTLAIVADAVRAAMAGGPLVVVGVEDVDEAAQWIAAVSFAMSAGTARRFYFSTLERPGTLAEAVKHELHLVCVPHDDLPALTRQRGIVVVDPGTQLALGDLDGEPHRTGRGDEIRVTEWSVLIQEAFVDAAAMVAAVGGFDRIAHTIGDSGLDPAWPAAMLLTQQPDAGSRREAARVMAEAAPPQLRSAPGLYAEAVAGLRHEVGGRLDRAWAHVAKLGADQDTNPATVAGEVAVGVYADLALADEPWLARHGPAKLPSVHYYSPAPEPGTVQIAGLLCQHISPFSADLPPAVMLDEARAGLHFVELALRLGLAHDDALGRRLWQVCQQTLIPVLLDRGAGPALVDSVDRSVARETRHWLWGQLSQVALAELGPPGERLGPAVLDTFGPGPDDPDPLAATWAWLSESTEPEDAEVSALVGEWAWHRVRGGDQGPNARFFAVWAALEAYAQQRDPAMLAAAARLLAPAWSPDRLIQLHLRWSEVMPVEWCVPALAEAGLDDPHAGFLAGELMERSGDAVAFVRGWDALSAPDWLRGPLTQPPALAYALLGLADGLATAKRVGAQPEREFLRRVNGLVVLGLLAARGRAGSITDPAALERAAGLAQAAVAGFPGADERFTGDETIAVVAWCDEHHVPTTALAELFLLADPRSSLRAPADRVAGWLHAVHTGAPDSPPITALVLAARLARSATSRDRSTEEILAALRSVAGNSDDRAARQTERFLQGWLRQAQTGRVRR
ncbi:MAG: hypothetical protein Q4F67_02610 [Propionibacteriaceae bacterium]|nr:hypothetical protein [Propionibacteriaceae bacterium]